MNILTNHALYYSESLLSVISYSLETHGVGTYYTLVHTLGVDMELIEIKLRTFSRKKKYLLLTVNFFLFYFFFKVYKLSTTISIKEPCVYEFFGGEEKKKSIFCTLPPLSFQEDDSSLF
jgi:hypothetical protein